MLSPQNQINKDTVIIVSLFKKPTIKNEYEVNELEQLINTLGGIVIDKVIQYRNKIDSKFYIGKGKLNSIYNYAIEQKCQYLVFNNDISPSHMKNIQAHFKDKIFVKDRTGIILDIFNKHAKTKESKTQIKLAQLEYSAIAILPPHISKRSKNLINRIHCCIFNVEQSIIKINKAQSEKDKNLYGLKLFYIYQFIKNRIILIRPFLVRLYYETLSLFKKNKLNIQRNIYICPICFCKYKLPYNKGLILLKCKKSNCQYNSYVNTDAIN